VIGEVARSGRTIAWLSRQIETALIEVELSLSQYRVLTILEREPEGASVIADELAVTRPTVTAIIDGLVNRGLVDRAPDELDRRRIRIRATTSGLSKLKKADAAVDARTSELLAKLGDPDQKTAINGLECWRRALLP
jgi:long-chain acyl-CoA synthetase